MRAIGIDPSLTSTGFAYPDGQVTIFATKAKGMERLHDLSNLVIGAVIRSDADVVAIEGYAYGARNSHAHALGELGGVLRLALWRAGVPYADVAPGLLKKYATGNGQADKLAMALETQELLGVKVKTSDEADALWLRAMALDAYGEPVVKLPKLNRSTLATVSWPTLSADVLASME